MRRCSKNHLGIFDKVVTVSSLDYAVNPRVELRKQLYALLDLAGGFGIGVQVSCLLWEEVGAEAFVSVKQNSVYVVVELSGYVLDEELDLVDEVTALGTLG